MKLIETLQALNNTEELNFNEQKDIIFLVDLINTINLKLNTIAYEKKFTNAEYTTARIGKELEQLKKDFYINEVLTK